MPAAKGSARTPLGPIGSVYGGKDIFKALICSMKNAQPDTLNLLMFSTFDSILTLTSPINHFLLKLKPDIPVNRFILKSRLQARSKGFQQFLSFPSSVLF